MTNTAHVKQQDLIFPEFLLGGDLPVRRIGFGTAWRKPISKKDAIAIIRKAVELGVNLFDTGDVYGPGNNIDDGGFSEEVLREALSPYNEDIVIVTKGGFVRVGPNRQTVLNCTPEHLREACEGSLKRLDLEQIPLYLLHKPDPNVAIEESLGALVDLQKEGKIKHIGLSNVTQQEINAALKVTKIAAIQNIFNQSISPESQPISFCMENNIAFMPHNPLARGALLQQEINVQGQALPASVSNSQLLLSLMLKQYPCMLPIPCTTSTNHLEENVEVMYRDILGAIESDNKPTAAPSAEVESNSQFDQLLTKNSYDFAGIKQAYKEYGCVLIKNALNIELLATCAQQAVNMRNQVKTMQPANDDDREVIEGLNQRGSICLQKCSPLQESAAELIRQSIVPSLMIDHHNSPTCMSLNISYMRWVHPSEGKNYAPAHQDSYFLAKESTNICAPVTGYGGEYPGLKLVPGIKEIMEADKIAQLLEQESTSWFPTVQTGDVLIFNKFIPHIRAFGNNADKERFNFELRLRPQTDISSDDNPIMVL